MDGTAMQTCVIDSCSFLHCFHINVGEFSLSDLLKQYFNVIMHQKVSDEADSVLPRAYLQWKAKGLVTDEMSVIRRLHSEWRVDMVRDADYESSKVLEKEKVTHLDDGEKGCLQLVKQASRELGQFVLFLTDDFDAGESARRMFDRYQIGFTLRSADLIMFFGLQLDLSKTEIHQALRSLLAFYIDEFETVRRELEVRLSGRSTVVVSLLDRSEFDEALKALGRMKVPTKEYEHFEKRISTLNDLTKGGIIGHIRSRISSLTELAI